MATDKTTSTGKSSTLRTPRKPADQAKTVPGHQGAHYGDEKGRPKDTGREGA